MNKVTMYTRAANPIDVLQCEERGKHWGSTFVDFGVHRFQTNKNMHLDIHVEYFVISIYIAYHSIQSRA